MKMQFGVKLCHFGDFLFIVKKTDSQCQNFTHLVPKLIIHGATHLLPQHIFIVWYYV